MKIITVTGAAGHIGYALIPLLLNSSLYAKEPIVLKLLEVPAMMTRLAGVQMEIEDSRFERLHSCIITSDSDEAFKEADMILLVGAAPRTQSMERKDLLAANAHIFKEQALSMERVARRSAIVLVVGNPCNTGALLVRKIAPSMTKVYSLMSLDQKRAQTMVEKHVGGKAKEVVVRGNHSSTVVVDAYGTALTEEVQKSIQKAVQLRGADVISARGASSAMSAACAIVDTAIAITTPTAEGGYYSVGVYMEERDLVVGAPCRTIAGEVKLASDIVCDKKLQKDFEASLEELRQERFAVDLPH